MRTIFAIFLILSMPVFGAESESLTGTWKLVSWQVVVDKEQTQNVFGTHPKGFLIVTREGRIMVLTVAETRQAGMGRR